MDPTTPRDNSQNPNSPQGPPTSPLTPSESAPISSDTPIPDNAWSPIEQPASGGPKPSFTPDGAGPILPGQFVVSGQDTPSPPQNIPTPAQTSPVNNSLPPSPLTADAQVNPNPISSSYDNLNVQDQLITPPSVGPEPVSVPPAPAATSSQPDPTPFAPPINQSAPGGFSKPPGGGIKKVRSLILILGIIVLLVIIGAVAWFFFFSNQANQAASTENQNQFEPTLQQQPIPKRSDGGFNEIQENSTPSSQLQESTPAAPAVPTP